jgi:ABC-type xylose transport system permease subunit
MNKTNRVLIALFKIVWLLFTAHLLAGYYTPRNIISGLVQKSIFSILILSCILAILAGIQCNLWRIRTGLRKIFSR